MFSRLSLLSSLPRSLAALPEVSRFPVQRLFPSCLPLSTSSCLQFNSRLVQPTKWPQDIHQKHDPFDGRQEMAKDGYGVTLYDLNDGKRKSMTAVVMRFKRLDWGAWIRPKSGRAKKNWKKDMKAIVTNQKHVFCKSYHKRRFDMAVTSDIKEIRHIPDDPYKVYNDMSWQNYQSIKLKNLELIKKHGPKNYDFPFYKSHYKGNLVVKGDRSRGVGHEPPNYHNDIASGRYCPDQDRAQDTMAPSYELFVRHKSKTLQREERSYFNLIRKCEHFYGRQGPCSPLRLPVFGTKLGP